MTWDYYNIKKSEDRAYRISIIMQGVWNAMQDELQSPWFEDKAEEVRKALQVLDRELKDAQERIEKIR